MKVKIIKDENSKGFPHISKWYKGKVGEIFEVKKGTLAQGRTIYYLISENLSDKDSFIDKDDCIEVE